MTRINRLKAIRQASNFTQEGLARKAGLTLATVNRLENSDGMVPQLRTARALAQALGVTVDEIWPTTPANEVETA